MKGCLETSLLGSVVLFIAIPAMFQKDVEVSLKLYEFSWSVHWLRCVVYQWLGEKIRSPLYDSLCSSKSTILIS